MTKNVKKSFSLQLGEALVVTQADNGGQEWPQGFIFLSFSLSRNMDPHAVLMGNFLWTHLKNKLEKYQQNPSDWSSQS